MPKPGSRFLTINRAATTRFRHVVVPANVSPAPCSSLLSRNPAIEKSHEKPGEKSQRINEQIRITPVRVVDQAGHMVGVIPTLDAQRLATEAGLDLVEVSPNERPPVCRIMDFGKFKYEQKRKHSQNTKTHQTQLKEIRLRPKTGTHDIEFKLKQARQFLEHKDKVKVNVVFRGRENAHHDRGREVLAQVVTLLEDIAKVEQSAKMDGAKQMSVVLAPKS